MAAVDFWDDPARARSVLAEAKLHRAWLEPVERLVTRAKNGTLHDRRLAFARLRDPSATKKLFDVLGPRFKDRPGGYCRILKLSKRRLGDRGERAILEFVERTPKQVEEPAEEKA